MVGNNNNDNNNNNNNNNSNTNNSNANNFGRDFNHDGDRTWNSTGKYIWDQVMRESGYTFENIAWSDIEADNSSVVMREFVLSCRRNPPIRRDNSGPYDSDSVLKSFNAGIYKLQRKFATQIRANPGDYFNEDEVKECRTMLRKNRSRNMMEGDDDSDLFKGIYPLPKKHSTKTRLFPLGEPPDPAMAAEFRNVDQASVFTELFRRAQFTRLVESQFTASGIGRSGEVKFLNYLTMFMECYFGLLFTAWFQRKILKSNFAGFVPEYEIPECCCYLGFGCFWACDDGLSRPEGIGEPKSPKRRQAYFVFQELHGIRDSSVAGRITGHIRSVIPDWLKNFFTGKSFRYASMSKLAWDPAVTYDESVALGGWTTSTNRDHYVWEYLVSIIPAVLSLADYPDCRVLPYNPTAGMLFFHSSLTVQQRFTKETYETFIQKLYIIDLPEFKFPNTPQRNLLVVVTAVMIMHFDYFYEKYGIQHAYCRKMVHSTMRSGVPFADTQSNAIELLQKWSRIVKDDFKKGNAPGNSDRHPLGRRTVADEIAKINTNISNLVAFRAEQQQQLQRIHDRVDEVTEELVQLKTKSNTMMELLNCVVTQNRFMQHRLNELLTHQGMPIAELPQTPENLRRSQIVANAVTNHLQQQAMDPQIVNPLSRESNDTPVRLTVSPGSQTTNGSPPTNDPTAREEPVPRRQATAPPRRTINEGLLRHRVASGTASRGVRNKEEALEKVLMTMYTDPQCGFPQARGPGRLDDRISWVMQKVFPTKDRQSQKKIQRVLLFVDGVWTEQERQRVIRRELSDAEALNFFTLLAKRCLKIAWTASKVAGIEAVGDEESKKKKCPKKSEPTKQASTQMLGMSNMLQTFEFDAFIPDYDKDGNPRDSLVTLQQYGEAAQQQLAEYVRKYHGRRR